MKCEHNGDGCCWLCSDQVSWWREARVRAGLGITPPNAWLREVRRLDALRQEERLALYWDARRREEKAPANAAPS